MRDLRWRDGAALRAGLEARNLSVRTPAILDREPRVEGVESRWRWGGGRRVCPDPGEPRVRRSSRPSSRSRTHRHRHPASSRMHNCAALGGRTVRLPRRLFFVDGPRGPRGFCQRHGKSYLIRRRRGGEGGGGGLLTGRAIPSAYRWAWCRWYSRVVEVPVRIEVRARPSVHAGLDRGCVRPSRLTGSDTHDR